MSICVPFYSHGWAAITEEEREIQPGVKPLKERATQVIMLGYTQPYTKPDKSGAKIYIKNAYQCYVPSLNKVMIRHDCNWSIAPETALSHFEPNTSNETDGVTSAEEEYDYDLLGMSKPVNDSWDPEQIDEDLLSEIDGIDEVQLKLSSPHLDNILDSIDLNYLADPEVPSIEEHTNETQSKPKKSRRARLPTETPTVQRTTSRINKGVPGVRFDDEDFANEVNIDTLHTSIPTPTTEQIVLIPSNTLYTPNTLEEAFSCPDHEHWRIAHQTEHTRLDKRTCYEILPEGTKPPKPPIKSKYTFRITVRPDGTLKYRVRLVACGYSQIQGVDYDETYAPTAKYISFCIIMHLAAVFGWLIEGLDVELAFIESEIDSEIYMTLPKGATQTSTDSKRAAVVVRLLRSLYGLKQAGELWYTRVKSILLSDGYTCLKHDKCIFIKRDNETGELTIVICYVDDVLYIGNSQRQITQSINHFRKNVTAITNMGNVTRYIGIDITRNLTDHTIALSQTPYIDRFVTSNIPHDANPKSTPMSDSVDYSKMTVETEIEKSIQPEVGQLRYLADHTKPDILTAVGLLGQVAAQPHQMHHKGIKHLARYLKGSRDIPLILGGTDEDINLFGYADASHLPDKTSKPRLGFCFYLNLHSGTIYARSVKSTNVSHSSCEAEINVIDAAAIRTIWIRGLLAELGYPQLTPTVIYTDSLSAKALADACQIGNNSAHITMRINFLHEQVTGKVIELKFINTENEVADVLTKLLPVESHRRHSEILLLGHKGIPPVIIRKADRLTMVPKPSMFKFDKNTNKFKHKLQAAKAKLKQKVRIS